MWSPRFSPNYAPVAPIEIYYVLDRLGLLGEYHFLIAHDVLEHLSYYERFYARRRGKRDFVILDNGLIELGAPLSAKDLARAAKAVNASLLILPDKLLDAKATVELSLKAAEELSDIDLGHCRLMAVAQGRSVEEALECARSIYMKVPRVAAFGVPRAMTKQIGTRCVLARDLYRLWGLPIHLLGFSDNLVDDMLSVRQEGVMGIDSAMPIWLGNSGRLLPNNPAENFVAGRRPENYWEMDDITSEAAWNIVTIRKWLM